MLNATDDAIWILDLRMLAASSSQMRTLAPSFLMQTRRWLTQESLDQVTGYLTPLIKNLVWPEFYVFKSWCNNWHFCKLFTAHLALARLTTINRNARFFCHDLTENMTWKPYTIGWQKVAAIQRSLGRWWDGESNWRWWWWWLCGVWPRD